MISVQFGTLSTPPGNTAAKRLSVLLILPLFASLSSAPAQPAPEITIKGSRGFPLAVKKLTGDTGSQATNLLQADLTAAGYFRFRNTPQGSFAAEGSASGNTINGRLLSPDGKELFKRSYSSGQLVRNVHQFADDIVFAVTGKPGIATSQIVFVGTKSGTKELFLCDYDGNNSRQLTRDRAISAAPAINADGSQVVYTGYQSGYPDVYLIDLVSGARSRIINSPGTNSGAAFSPDGNKIALSMSFSGNPEIYVTNAKGKSARQITKHPAVDSSPTWSPDGRHIIFVSDRTGNPQLYTVSASGGSPQRLGVGYGFCTEPSLSPDGQRLAFTVRSGGSNAIAVYHFQTRNSQIVASGGAEDPAWGADSKHLIYTKNNSLYMLDVETGATNRVISGMGRISEPSWTR
ncbi:MAG: biopolymer transporter Tol [Verrucomicrobiota bacterium]